jgi:nitroreductase
MPQAVVFLSVPVGRIRWRPADFLFNKRTGDSEVNSPVLPSHPVVAGDFAADDAPDSVSLNPVDRAIERRQAMREFLPTPVPRATIEHLLELASRAPSGTNTQPWKAYVLQGASRDALVEKVCQVHDALRASPALAAEYQEQYDYYPEKWVSPYIDRRRENGWSLYGLLGITKGDKEKMHLQHQRNYRFFDAPVGLMFTLDKVMGRGSLLDYGMFMENFMIAARGHGLHTCPQAAWNGFAKIVLPHIGAGENEMLVCGIALGYADETARVNTFRTPRVSAAEFTTWLE